jgi:hypothetical protein
MPRRIYPVSYLVMVFQVLFISVLIAANFFAETPRFSQLSFFFLGVGFMLIETKGITEMGLTFGNTWQVIGVVIAGILTMAFLGNCAVQWLSIKRTLVPYLFLLAALALGWLVARSGGFASAPVHLPRALGQPPDECLRTEKTCCGEAASLPGSGLKALTCRSGICLRTSSISDIKLPQRWQEKCCFPIGIPSKGRIVFTFRGIQPQKQSGSDTRNNNERNWAVQY